MLVLKKRNASDFEAPIGIPDLIQRETSLAEGGDAGDDTLPHPALDNANDAQSDTNSQPSFFLDLIFVYSSRIVCIVTQVVTHLRGCKSATLRARFERPAV